MKAKRFLIFVPALILALLLCGCLQTVISLDIKSDLSDDIDVKMGIDEDYYEMAGGADAFSNLDTADAEGFSTSEYSADGYKGVEAKGTIADITKDNEILESMLGSGAFSVGEGDQDKTITFRASASGIQSEITGEAGYSLSELESYGKIDLRIVITFPYAIKESNATQVSGNTATWDLLKFNESEMFAVTENGGGFGLGGGFPMWLIIVIIIVAAAIVVLLILLNLKKKKAAGAAGYTGYQAGAYNPQPGAYTPEAGAAAQQPVQYGTYEQQPAQYGSYASRPAVQAPEPENIMQQAEETVVNAPQPDETVPVVNVQDTAADAEETVAEAAPKMAFCPQCGHKLPENGAFCPGCGHKVR